MKKTKGVEMSVETDLSQMITEFQEKWDGNSLDLIKAAKVLDASHTVLKTVLRKKPTTNQVIEFSKVIVECDCD